MKNNSTQNVATQFLSTEEGRIAFDVTGSGPLVVLVPGMGDLRSSYRFLSPKLVAAGYTVVTTDLRGHGESDADFGSYGDADTARDVIALVESLHRPAFIIGNSMAAGAAGITGVTAAVHGGAKAAPDELLRRADLCLASPRDVGRLLLGLAGRL